MEQNRDEHTAERGKNIPDEVLMMVEDLQEDDIRILKQMKENITKGQSDQNQNLIDSMIQNTRKAKELLKPFRNTDDWSPEEQKILEEGLAEPFHGPIKIKYAKIASRLNNKTARDVAFRRNWMVLLKEEDSATEEREGLIDEVAVLGRRLTGLREEARRRHEPPPPTKMEIVLRLMKWEILERANYLNERIMSGESLIGGLMRLNNRIIERIYEIGGEFRHREEKEWLIKLYQENQMKMKQELDNAPFYHRLD